ncbi:serine hydrolase-like protein [Oppia nitens]|uniref:serine hydrolase-like protein n=1 Tax=Oppia nitens TaxID=1686743 RepID=UPI0023DBA23F|nr:serine hydrolase-like protein [Oppia nitens]
MSDCSELRVDTTYGKIAIKVWGKPDENRLKLLCVHGWQDNAGTFDRLLPLLDLNSLYVLCVDLPGHGFSSHLPKGAVYTDLTWIMELKRIVDHLNWTKFSILSHSMGANASLSFAVMFPDLVDRVITLDTVKPAVFPINECANRLATDINEFMALEERNNRKQAMGTREPVFNYDMAITVLKSAHSPIGNITSEGAACLLKRATKIITQKDSKPGYVFTRDYRLQKVLNRKIDCQSLLGLFSGLKCELMIINGKNGLFTDRDLQKRFLELYQNNCKKFVYVEVDGDHYVHLTSPQKVVPHIKQFLSEPINDLMNHKL